MQTNVCLTKRASKSVNLNALSNVGLNPVMGVEMNTIRRVQYQEPNVLPGYGVGWRSPPGLVESVGINSWADLRLGVG